MEYLLCFGIVVGLPIWFVARSIAAAKQQSALAEYSWSLCNWENHAEGYDLRISFPEMTGYEHGYSDDYLFNERTQGPVRRGMTHWEIQRLVDGRQEWQLLREDFQPRIETAYQRFIHRS